MRDQQEIERELESARHDLEQDVSQLKEVVRSKVDIRQRAKDAVERGKQEVVDLGRRVGTGTREHPWTAIAFLAGVIALVATSIYVARRRASAC
ncbi:MAG: hypothetical protein JWO36_5478 [Myxococcales bacterium]|nr:hypothetical protein [Myxococcales bacterium]